MLTQQNFVQSILEGSKELEELTNLLGDVTESYTRNLATMMFILETCKTSAKSKDMIAHIKENYSKVLTIVETYSIQLPEEMAIIEKVVKQLSEDGAGAGGTAGGISGGSGGAAGSVSTAALAATPQVDTTAIDAKTPRIYPNKKRKPHNVIIS